MNELPDLTSPVVIKSLLNERRLRPSKKHGQNFLIDANIAAKIVAASAAGSGTNVIEIGPGAGALTAALSATGAFLVAVEVDRGLALMLQNLFAARDNVKIIHRDIMKTGWPELIKEAPRPSRPFVLVSNLPYNISGPFTYNLFFSGLPFVRAILMFQKEVAQRLVAAPGTGAYGALSVFCSHYSKAAILFRVSANCFWPRPKVESAVVAFEPRPGDLREGEEYYFRKIVRGAFQQRRKRAINSIAAALNRPRDELKSLFALAELCEDARAEEIDAGRFALLAQIAYNYFSQVS